ncbi:MAG: gamma-glutamylcyclotransferase [Betaproteobacteria bacterium]|nr:gamma-glutamylcyclotransferase [Betaproteobacteria bacterium]
MTHTPVPCPSELALPAGDLWIFGYGSLMWDPGFPYVKWAPALVYGYHRALCIYSIRWRGTLEQPGLVLGLDRGGACRGIAFRVEASDVSTALEALWEREMRRGVYHPRLLRARLPGSDVRVLAFIADPLHPGYAGGLSVEQTARLIATRGGDRGPNIEYLVRTLKHLAELGVRDHYLQRVLAAARALRPGGS